MRSASCPECSPLRATLVFAALCVVVSGTAWARPVRRLFEPTDLDLEDSGVMEVDLQAGLIRGHGPYRVSVPDFEVDVGLTRAVEFDIDGGFALEDSAGQNFSFDQFTADNLWVSLKGPLLDIRDPDRGWGVGVGLQVGPKLPIAPQAAGVGCEGLVLLGLKTSPLGLTFNMGGLIDPGAGAGGRPSAVEGGVDFSYPLDSGGRWSATAEVGGVYYFSSDPNQLTMTAGVAFDPTDSLEVSVVGLAGAFSGSDRYGVLLGISPKFHLWH